jgi:hypothetical protein
MSSSSKKKEPRYTYLSEVKASHSQRKWAKVSSSAPTSYTVDCLTAPLGKEIQREIKILL